MKSRFGKVLDSLLKLRDMSGRELSRKANLCHGSVSHYMTGRNTPRGPVLTSMAKVLRVPRCMLVWFAHVKPNHSTIFVEVENIMREKLREKINQNSL